ncbi:transposase [Mariprofundus erugo]|uniref:transposase n=1 Tax=Mariprofundus erugo TaxID=2528639 RepID=UPI0010FD4711|nr:transposase [Mariprofundus erugo]TLS72880.1 transposase [Mariprofundus erugo]
MPRANRYHIPHQIWHITHRCHRGEFLLKFARDRDRWMHWLFEAKQRYGLCILNYIVTSNHIHLLVVDDGNDAISKSIQLIAGRVGQEYNQRKHRKGAFWEDRYHATAIESGGHLLRCLVYIDMNMVRAGKIGHPVDWKQCGYSEIQAPPHRYRVIDRQKLIELCGFSDAEQFTRTHREWVEAAIKNCHLQRMPEWTEAVAVGSREFAVQIKGSLAGRADSRTIMGVAEGYELREPDVPYNDNLDDKMGTLSSENTAV